MSIFIGIVVFLLVWWTLLFAVLPFGHRRDVDGTPVIADMKKKFIWTTIVSIVVWGMIFALVESDVISFRDLADTMMKEDFG